MRVAFRILLLAFLPVYCFSQSTPAFETNPQKFLLQVKNLLEETKRDDLKKLSKDFDLTWVKYSDAQQQEIIALCNQMHERKMLLTPYFIDFFQIKLCWYIL